MKNRLAIGIVSVLAGVALFGCSQDAKTPEEVASDPASSVAQPAAAPANAGPPTTLPDVKLKNREGELQSIRSWPDKSMIVNFWATWCGPCRKEIPFLKEIGQKEKDFQIVGIAIDYRDDVLKYADEIKIDYPLLIGEQEGFAAADAFGVSSPGLPFTAFTDNQGRIVTMLMGELTEPKAEIILGAVKRVNKGELTPEKARAEIQVKLDALKA